MKTVSKSLPSLSTSSSQRASPTSNLSYADSMYFKVAAKFTQFKPEELDMFIAQFRVMDKNGNGHISVDDLKLVCQEVGENVNENELARKISEVDLNRSDAVEFDEFLQFICKLREGRVGADKGFGATYQKQVKLVKVQGATDSTTHSINQEEQVQFCIHINNALRGDQDLKNKLPINIEDFRDLYDKVADGLLLSKLINNSVSDTIDERVLNKGKLNAFQMSENNNIVVNSAKAIGCSVVNIGSQDLIEGREHLVLGLVWQIIKIGLFAKVDLEHHPELFRLLDKDESLEDFLKLPVDQILLRWFNYHLKKAEWTRKVTNFSSDIKDSENYIVLLNQLAPELCNRSALTDPNLDQRAESMLTNADKLGCRAYVTAKSVVQGNPKLNLAFVANLFNKHPGLEPLSEEEKAQLDEKLFSSQGDREARAFALWLNSLGVEPFVNNLYEDLKDGIVLLQAIDKIHPGTVDWKKVNTKAPLSRFKAVENTNLAVVLGKSFKYSLVGIQGADITDGSKKLTLALTWQLMRDNVLQVLQSLSRDGSLISEELMISWANSTVKRANKTSVMKSFRDTELKTGLFFLDVMSGIKKGIVDYSFITDGSTAENAKLNAKYAISVARKLGATIFLLPEDITEVKSKMILTFIGALMAIDIAQNS